MEEGNCRSQAVLLVPREKPTMQWSDVLADPCLQDLPYKI